MILSRHILARHILARHILARLVLAMLAFFMLTAPTRAQVTIGARQAALANSDAALRTDAHCIFSNPSAVEKKADNQASASYAPSPFGLKELSRISFAYMHRFGNFSASFGYTSCGYELFRESSFLLSGSLSISGRLCAAAAAAWNTLAIKGYGSAGTVSFNIGLLAEVTGGLYGGFYLKNLTRASYTGEEGEIPGCLALGFSYELSQAVLTASVEKEMTMEASVRTGVELLPVEFFKLRFGLNTYPQYYSAGAGILYKAAEIDYAVTIHPELGMTHMIGVVVEMGE